jgi:hypothetical protein
MRYKVLSFPQVNSQNSLRNSASRELTNGNSSLAEPVATSSFLGIVGQSSGLRNVLQLVSTQRA